RESPGWNRTPRFIVDHVPRLSSVGQRITARPCLPRVERVQQVNVRAGSAIIESPAVVDAGDVAATINPEHNVAWQVWFFSVGHTHVTGMLLRADDVLPFDDVRLVVLALKVG